ncbi:MAG: response regulator [Bacteroidota bacterium]
MMQPSDMASVLVVEDNEFDRFLIQDTIKRRNLPLQVHIMQDGFDAREFLSEPEVVPPSLIVLDLNMPRMDGFELLKWLRVRDAFKQVPIIILTCSESDADRKMAMQEGATDYLLKPMDVDQMEQVVVNLFQKWALQVE